jgi:DNA primase
MRSIPDTTGFNGYGDLPGEVGDSSTALTGKAFYKDLIHKANTVPIIKIFQKYKLRVNTTKCNITCPFKSHKGGRESSASFWYYPDTNSYCCFGCRVGSHGCDFVAEMEGVTRSQAAAKIINWFGADVDEDEMMTRDDLFERLEIMLDFSNAVRQFRQSHFDEIAHARIEYICRVYDDLNARHPDSLNNEALRNMVEQLKKEISSYKPCLTL